MFDEINHPAFKIMIDTNPMEVPNETIWQWFETFGDNTANMHFIEANPYGHPVTPSLLKSEIGVVSM